jgi:hypothetical protein
MPRISCCMATGLGAELRLGALVTLGGGRVGEHAEAGVHADLRHARHQRMQHLAGDAQPGGDAHRLADAGLRHHVGGLFGAQRGHVLVDVGGRDHGRAHQRHVDGGEAHALVGKLAAGAARPGVQRGLAGHVGAESAARWSARRCC